MARKYEELIGTFDFERNVFGCDEERTIIGALSDGRMVKGKARDGQLETGLSYRFYGAWTKHPKYGSQFVFHSVALAMPNGRKGTIAYLQRVRGIGRKRAEVLWDKFGAESINAIREKPDEVALAIGVDRKVIDEAVAYFDAIKSREQVTIALEDLLTNRGMPRSLNDLLIQKYGATAADAVKNNPYLLLQYRGVGFAKADKLYLDLGHDPNAIDRQGYCAWHKLHQDSEGHTWYPLAFACQGIDERIAGAECRHREAISWAVERRLLAVNKGVWVAEYHKANAEYRLASLLHLAELETTAGGTLWPSLDAVAGPSDHQREQAALAMQGYVGILAGRPGTGKTYLLAKIIEGLGKRPFAVVAPTGKAAVRAQESLAKAGLQGISAKTIHRLLGVESAEDGQWRFFYGEKEKLPFQFIFVDEASMIDTPLMASLFAARPERGHILLIGDTDQLSPVGHGAPLRDLSTMEIPQGKLTEIRRNSGRIVSVCKDIAERHTFQPSPKRELPEENFVWIEKRSPEEQIETLRSLMDRIAVEGQSPRWDTQVLVPVNDKSPISRKALNTMLQGWLNADGNQMQGCPFRAGDKVICTQNGQLVVEPSFLAGLKLIHSDLLTKTAVYATDTGDLVVVDDKTFVANGEMGRVVELLPWGFTVRMSNPERLVKVFRSAEEPGETGCTWELGYAISTHKSQGSEWPIVVVMIDSQGGAMRLVDRCWLYTAFSRAKEVCYSIGKMQTALIACLKSHIWKRQTFLKETVEELRVESVGLLWEQDLESLCNEESCK